MKYKLKNNYSEIFLLNTLFEKQIYFFFSKKVIESSPKMQNREENQGNKICNLVQFTKLLYDKLVKKKLS